MPTPRSTRVPSDFVENDEVFVQFHKKDKKAMIDVLFHKSFPHDVENSAKKLRKTDLQKEKTA